MSTDPSQLSLPAELLPADLGPAPEPTPVAAAKPITKRSPGRPKGARTNPKIKAATRARTGKPPLAEAAAEAAAQALEREAKGGRPSATAKQSQAMQDGLQSFYSGAGAIISVLGGVIGNRRMVAGGSAAVAQAGECARALVAWSETNASVRKALESLTTAGGAALVLAAHGPIVAAVISGTESTPEDGGSDGIGTVETAQGFDLGTLVGLLT